MIISVQQKHIDKGYRRNYEKCAVALAIKERTHRPVEINEDYITLFRSDRNGGDAIMVPTPDCVSEFINLFDESGPKFVEPFEFELAPPKG